MEESKFYNAASVGVGGRQAKAVPEAREKQVGGGIKEIVPDSEG